MRKRLLVIMAATMVLGLCMAGRADAYKIGDAVQYGCTHHVPNLNNYEGACAILRYGGSDAGGPIYYFEATASPEYANPPVKLIGVAGHWKQWYNPLWVSEGVGCSASSKETPYPQILACSTAPPVGPLHHCPHGIWYEIDVTVTVDSQMTSVDTHESGTWAYNNYCP